jgi:hemin uptake protein HemP
MTQALSQPASACTTGPTSPAAAVEPCVSSAEILRGQKTVAIHHNGSTYKLQATRLGKLILTK